MSAPQTLGFDPFFRPDPSLPVPDFSNPRAQRYAVNRSPQVTSVWANWFGQEPGPDHGNIKP
jgi:hypothetical protein